MTIRITAGTLAAGLLLLPTTSATAEASISRTHEGNHTWPVEEIAAALLESRAEPFREPDHGVVSASTATFAQEYYDTCHDASYGDIDRVFQLDDQGAIVGWEWTTCADRPFHGTDDELLLFRVDQDLHDPVFRDDYAIAQFMDGYYAVYRTFELSDVSSWLLLDSGFGSVGRSSDGRRTVGSFIIDGDATLFPFVYRFQITTAGGGQLLDAIPNADQHYPTFPTNCSLMFFSEAQLLVEPGRLPAVQRAVENLGLSIVSTAPMIGALTVDRVDDGLFAVLADLPGVALAERPKLRTPAATNDPEPSAWATEQLRLEAGWQIVPSHHVHVAVIDQGVDASRADLAGRVGAGYDSVRRRTIPAGQNSAMGDHGTAVAGVIAATRNNGREVAGVNQAAIIRPIRLTAHDGCISSEAIVAAIDAALAMPEVRLINMSFGGPASTIESAALDRAAAAGKIMVAATGNDGETAPGRARYPAAHPQVIGVGASTADGQVAPYSQPAAVDVIAPGGAGSGDRTRDISLLWRFNTIGYESGTSFAAPYVTGALSLWLAANPNATTDDARAALQAAAIDVPATTADGAGVLDVGKLLTPVAAPRFNDVVGTTHEEAIDVVAVAGITGGFADGTFRPGQNVTRGQMAAFLARALELPATAGGAFDDAVGTTHETSIAAVAAAGITGGFADGTFRPGQNVTRGQMAAFLARALDM